MEKQDKIDAAKRLFNDQPLVDLLSEYLLEVEEKLNPSVIQNMTDEQVGQITRAELVADQKIRERFGRIKNLTTMTGKPKPAAKS